VSSPQLYNNNNNYEIAQKSDSNNNNTTELRSISNRLNAITRPSSLYYGSNSEIVKNLPERQRNNSESSEIQNIFRESGSKQNSLGKEMEIKQTYLVVYATSSPSFTFPPNFLSLLLAQLFTFLLNIYK
jgi:hypothetical protein